MNSKAKIIILPLIIAAAGFWIFRTYTASREAPSAAESRAALYYCPMHPTYTSDRPGECPICHMQLVRNEDAAGGEHAGHAAAAGPLKAVTVKELMGMKPGEVCLLHKCKMGNCEMVMTEDIARLGKCPHCGEDLGVIIKDLMPAGYGPVSLSSDKQRLIGIKTAPALKKKITKTIRTVGRIAHDPELYQAEEEYVQAFQALKKAEGGAPEIREQAQRLLDSSRIKLKLMGLSDELIKQVEEAGKPDRSLLYSEAGGTVWLYAPIYEYEIPLVKPGTRITAEMPPLAGGKVEGNIRAIDSVLDPMTRSVRVRAVLNNPDGALKPEMYVNANVEVDLGEVLVVPSEAVFSTGEKNIVFVEKAGGSFEPREVRLGVKSDSDQEIKSGVSENEKVVVSGNFLIDSESRLKGALAGLGGGEHQHGQ